MKHPKRNDDPRVPPEPAPPSIQHPPAQGEARRPSLLAGSRCPRAGMISGAPAPPPAGRDDPTPQHGGYPPTLEALAIQGGPSTPRCPLPAGPYGTPSLAFDGLFAAPAGPVILPSGIAARMFVTHRDVAAAHKDPRLLRSEAVSRRVALVPDARMELAGGVLPNTDGAEHAVLRDVFAGSFGHDHAGRWAEVVREAALNAIDGLPPSGDFDLRADYFEPVARGATERIFGFPMDQGPRILELIFDERLMLDLQARLLDAIRGGEWPAEASCLDRLGSAYREGLINDLDLANNLLVILAATYQGIGGPFLGGLFALLRDRSQWETCLRDRAVLPNAVDESLRCFPNGDAQFLRVAREDLTLGGVAIRRGEAVMAPFAAANVDPAVFPEPRRFDVRRANSGEHLAFGVGKHFCLGWLLAKVWMRTAFEVLLDRLPTLELAVEPEAVIYRPMQLINVMERLPVRAR